MENNETNRFYKFIIVILSFLSKILFRIEVIGKDNLPKTGRIIVAANHKSNLDPIFMMLAMKDRQIIPVAKKELFEVFLLKNILKKLGVIPIDRENPSITTIKAILNQIKLEKPLAIFPEGTRCKTDGFLPAKPGVALFALKTKAQVIPMSIISSYKLFSRVKIVIGEAVGMEEYYNRKVNKEEYQDIAQKIMDDIVKNYIENK